MPQVAAQLHERARRTADCANSDTAENSVHAVFDTFATHQKHIFDSEQRKYSILLPLALFARIVGPHAPRDVHIPAGVTDGSPRGRARRLGAVSPIVSRPACSTQIDIEDR